MRARPWVSWRFSEVGEDLTRMSGPAPAASPSREVAGALAWSLIGKLLVSLLGIASNILIVRGLGENAYGVYSIFLNIAHFLALVIGLGLSQTVLQFLPEMRARRDGRGMRELLWRGLWLQLATWAVVLGLVWLLRGWLSGLFHADLRQILPLGAALLLLESLWSWVVSIYTAMRRMIWLTIVSVIQKGVLIGLLLVLLKPGPTVTSVLLVVGGSFFAGLLLLGPGMPPLLRWGAGSGGAGLPAGRHLRYALAIALGAVINQMLWRSSGTLFIGYFRLPADAGYYNAAYNLAQLILEFVPLAIWPVILAVLSEAHAMRSEDLLRGTRLYFRLTFVLVLPVAMSGLALGDRVYLAMYGAAMAPGATLCQFFFAVFLVGFLTMPLRMALYVKERAMANALVSGAGAIVNVALNLVLVPRYGIWGAAWAVLIALALTGLLQYELARRLLPGARIPWGDFVKILPAAAIALPLWFVRSSFSHPLPLLGVLAGITLVQFALLRLLRVFGPEECELLLKSKLPLRHWLVRLMGYRST